MADTPKSSPESQTYGQLYEKIRANIALTPDEQKTLQKKIMLNGFLARKDEIITDAEKARNELSLMLTDSPLILAKLNHALDAHLPTGKSTLAKAKEQ